MADDDSRRGVSNMADADTTQQSTDNPQVKTSEKHTNSTEAEVVATEPTEKLAENEKTLPDEQVIPKNSTEVIPTASKVSEEKQSLLAKAREELNKAKEESARARDEVEKAKKDLAVAKQDTCAANRTAPEEKQQTDEINLSLSQPTLKAKVEEEMPSQSDTVSAIAKQVDNTKNQPEQETQLDIQKGENLVKDDSVNSNQNCHAISRNTEDGTDKPAKTPESQLAMECKSTVDMTEAEPNTDSLKEIGEKQRDNNKEGEHVESIAQKEEEVKDESHLEENQPVEDQGSNPEEEKNEEAGLVEGENEEGEVIEDEEEEAVEGEHEEDEIVEGEREEGDGEESDEEDTPAKPLDDDEDRRNPQYIPKRGGFYEHDDRNREEVEEAVTEEPEVEEKPKKNRSEAIDRWGHDMFDPNQQGPKTGDELVDAYGYDIRQEEGAPRARRRRRYGRGPNKYDRTWEDEDAYSRPRGRGGAATRGGPSERGSGFDRNSDGRPQRSQRQEMPKKDEFPALSENRQEPRAQGENNPKPSSQSNWREGERGVAMTGGSERRGGGNGSSSNNSKANAISFRRGGGGRTFEERRESKESKAVKIRGENLPQSGEPNEQNTAEQPPKENFRSPRKAGGEASTRGASSRGGSSRGSGNRGDGAMYAGSSRGGGSDAAPRGRGAPNARGRRNDNPNWDRGDGGNIRGGASHQGFSRGQRASQDVRMDHRGPYEEPRGRGRGKFGRPMEGNSEQAVVSGMEQVRIEDQSAPSRNQDTGRSKRYSSQRQRMTTPPPANTGPSVIQQPSYPIAAGGNTAYYASYNDSQPPNFVSAAPAPLLPMAVTAQGAPPSFIAQTMYPAGPGPAPFNAGPYQGYPPAAAPPAVPVGVPIGSPTQDNMYGGGIMYYDPGRQPIRHGTQPTRRAKAAIPIVAPDNDVDSYLISGRRPNHE
ncbi:protein CASC3-like isoform X2 [Daphnia carinata]|uniref:protein CASC3-like isoform X2 n=1 Tax=Daphnia carinata TaxID=120202 RepID=UPI002868E75E|nr:protein CASC3-like isoform X2 [Daphnia carinata]